MRSDLPVQRGLTAVENLEQDAALFAQCATRGEAGTRWYVVSDRALVTGFAQVSRADAVVDRTACAGRGVVVLARRAGGGLVLLDEDVLCLTVALPAGNPLAGEDVTESYRWLGEVMVTGLRALGVAGARRVEVAEAREDQGRLRADNLEIARLLSATCFGGLSPHEVVVDKRPEMPHRAPPAKVIGLAQVRRREGTLYQCGILLRRQADMADLVRVTSNSEREGLRETLMPRTAGLWDLLGREGDVEQVALTLESEVRRRIKSAELAGSIGAKQSGQASRQAWMPGEATGGAVDDARGADQ